jgi:hypothetical protein
MLTDELVARLSQNVPVVPLHAAVRRLCYALATGAIVAFVLLVTVLGVRPDFVQAAHTAPFWMKWIFTLSLTGSALVVVRRLGRPDEKVGLAWWGLIAPSAIVAMMGIGELIAAPPANRAHLVLGHTALQCTLAIFLLAVPAFIGLVRAFRRLAPTRLRLAGLGAGVLAGAVGASVYAFTCPESSAAFMASWYTVGVFAAGALGAALGPRVMRW